MKKLALCVAPRAIATGAMAQQWKSVRLGLDVRLDARHSPLGSAASGDQTVGIDAVLTKPPRAKTKAARVRAERDIDAIISALQGKPFAAPGLRNLGLHGEPA